MLSSLRKIMDTKIIAEGREAGQAMDVLFDPVEWAVRYIIVDMGNWMKDKKVLIPMSLLMNNVDWSSKSFKLEIAKAKIEDMPSLESVDLISGEHEDEVHKYFGVPPYWVVGVTASMVPGFTPEDRAAGEGYEKEEDSSADDNDAKGKLLRGKNLLEFVVSAVDEEVGTLKDLVFDVKTGRIHYMVIDAWNITSHREVIITTLLVKSIDIAASSVIVDCDLEKIERSPDYFSFTKLDRKNEIKIHEHYGTRKYLE
ncbi:MAG: hypothetical protein GF307_00465 [candidate division Zixibacteria bacterium]|nr:hypothetical protein [candidate division Zixibacteria bacterium]